MQEFGGGGSVVPGYLDTVKSQIILWEMWAQTSYTHPPTHTPTAYTKYPRYALLLLCCKHINCLLETSLNLGTVARENCILK